jgi:hypothetical protein
VLLRGRGRAAGDVLDGHLQCGAEREPTRTKGGDPPIGGQKVRAHCNGVVQEVRNDYDLLPRECCDVTQRLSALLRIAKEEAGDVEPDGVGEVAVLRAGMRLGL